jgi:hypothetical protein
MKSLALAILLLFAAATSYANHPEFRSIGGVGFLPDTKHNVDDDIFFVIGGEIPISERWSVAADYFSVDTDT